MSRPANGSWRSPEARARPAGGESESGQTGGGVKACEAGDLSHLEAGPDMPGAGSPEAGWGRLEAVLRWPPLHHHGSRNAGKLLREEVLL